MKPWAITCTLFCLLKAFNPDIAVIGDFIGVSRSNHLNPDPALQLHESEVVAVQAIVDLYARADFFCSYGEVVTLLRKAYRQVPRFFEEPVRSLISIQKDWLC